MNQSKQKVRSFTERTEDDGARPDGRASGMGKPCPEKWVF